MAKMAYELKSGSSDPIVGPEKKDDCFLVDSYDQKGLSEDEKADAALFEMMIFELIKENAANVDAALSAIDNHPLPQNADVTGKSLETALLKIKESYRTNVQEICQCLLLFANRKEDAPEAKEITRILTEALNKIISSKDRIGKGILSTIEEIKEDLAEEGISQKQGENIAVRMFNKAIEKSGLDPNMDREKMLEILEGGRAKEDLKAIDIAADLLAIHPFFEDYLLETMFEKISKQLIKKPCSLEDLKQCINETIKEHLAGYAKLELVPYEWDTPEAIKLKKQDGLKAYGQVSALLEQLKAYIMQDAERLVKLSNELDSNIVLN